MMLRRIPVFIALMLACSIAAAQQINGVWHGTMTISPGGCFTVYNIELQINIDPKNQVQGVSYHYSDLQNYVKEEFTGHYDPNGQLLFLSENKVLTYHVPVDCEPCIKKFELVYKSDEKSESLSGSMGGRMMKMGGICPPGKIVLTRVKESAFKEVEEKKAQVETFGNKKLELVREIKVDTGDIRLDFYDNGIIDGDTISVFANNQLIVTNKGLTTVPITVYVRVDEQRREQEVVMVGQNLGSIPPNTALMIVTAGNKRYQLYLTSDNQKNSMVRFVYERSD